MRAIYKFLFLAVVLAIVSFVAIDCPFAQETYIELDLSSIFDSGVLSGLRYTYGYEDKTGIHEIQRRENIVDRTGFELKVERDGTHTHRFVSFSQKVRLTVITPTKTWWFKMDGRIEKRGSFDQIRVPTFINSAEYPCQILLKVNGEPKEAVECSSGSCSKNLTIESKEATSFAIEARANGPLFYPLLPSLSSYPENPNKSGKN